MPAITRNTCPVCQSASIAEKLEATDYTVSHRQFSIWECAGCSLRFTQGIPPPEEAGSYYASDKYISHTDIREGVVNRLYHLVRALTLRKKLQLIRRTAVLQQGSLLDIGAGTGAFLYAAKTAGWQVTGLEQDEQTRSRAVHLHGISLYPAEDLFNLPAENYDVITMWHVLEHVYELHASLDQVKGLLREQGRLLVAVPNYTSYDATHYGSFWAAYDVPRHLYHFSPAAMKTLLGQHGLKLLGIKPMWFDSFYIAMLSEQYKNGKGSLPASVWTGFRSNAGALRNPERCSSLIYIIGKQAPPIISVPAGIN